MTKRQKTAIEKSRKRLQSALKKSTKLKLLGVIRAALDCPSHFFKPVIKRHKDEIFSYGDHPIVLCSQCVDRMREVLVLENGESCPPAFQYEGWSAVEK